MKKQLGLVAFLLCATLAAAQDDYSTWSRHKNVVLNTSTSGARVITTVTNFPVLVRLGAADSAIFAQAAGNGSDIRFSKSNLTVHIPYQIERWDSAGKSAVIWVLVDTVLGNINNQRVRMHWGKPGAADSSNGSAVFKTASGFQAVWHMNGATATSNEADATANAFLATQNGSPAAAAGAIAGGRVLNGTSNYFSTTGTASGPLDFPQNGNYSISAWVNAANSTGNATLISKNDKDYAIKLYANGNWEFFEFDDAGWNSVMAPGTANIGVWEHIEGVWSGTEAALYINGALVNNVLSATAATGRVTNTNVTIGRQNESTNRYFGGTVDEIRMSSVSRDSNWVRLEYQNQQASQTLVSLSDTIPALAVAPILTSSLADQNLTAGGTAKFAITALGGGTTLTFKWVKNNTDTVRTATATGSDTLTLTNVLAADNNATYKCVVRNSAGQVVSNSATLLVTVSILKGQSVKGFSISTSGSSMSFHLPSDVSGARISVIDLWGRTIWSHVAGNGIREVTWNGIGVNGRSATSGIYLIRMELSNSMNPSIRVLERKVLFTR